MFFKSKQYTPQGVTHYEAQGPALCSLIGPHCPFNQSARRPHPPSAHYTVLFFNLKLAFSKTAGAEIRFGGDKRQNGKLKRNLHILCMTDPPLEKQKRHPAQPVNKAGFHVATV